MVLEAEICPCEVIDLEVVEDLIVAVMEVWMIGGVVQCLVDMMTEVKGVIQMIDLEVMVVNNDTKCLNGYFCMTFDVTCLLPPM